MNATIIKQVWHASWEMRLLMAATFLAGLTGNDIAPYILWMPDVIEGYVAQYWNIAVIVIAAWLRGQKTSSKLVMFEKDATPEAEVLAAKAALKPPSATKVAEAVAILESHKIAEANAKKV